jgi:hypothetical protein
MTTRGIVNAEAGGFEVEIHFSASPGTPDVMYLPNGDPGYPGDPPELEVGDIWLLVPVLEVGKPSSTIKVNLREIFADISLTTGSELDAWAYEVVERQLDSDFFEPNYERPEREESIYD